MEEKIRGEAVYDGVLLKVYKDEVLLENGHKGVREWIKHPGAAAVIALLPDKQIILVRQYRYPIGQETLEVPAGKLDKEEEPLECAKRELSEETGYRAEKMRKLTTIATTVGFTNEYIHLYAASGLKVGEQHPDADELINVVKMPLTEAVEMIERGKIIDAKSIIAILLIAKRLKEGAEW